MSKEANGRMDLPLFRGGDGVAMEFDGKSFSFRSDRPEIFRAKITGSTGTSPIAYSWVEVSDTITGVGWEEKTSGRFGSVSASPAYELNNFAVPDGSLVFMREKCYAPGAADSTVYEFAYGGASAPVAATVVTSIQCTGNQLIVGYEEIGG